MSAAVAERSACPEIARQYLDVAPAVCHVPVMRQLAALASGTAGPEDRALAAAWTRAGHAPIGFAHCAGLFGGELGARLP